MTVHANCIEILLGMNILKLIKTIKNVIEDYVAYKSFI